MADVLHRTTKQYLRSVHTPDHPEADWIINPVLTAAVRAAPTKYWKISGDTVTKMLLAERNAVDAAEQAEADADDREATKLQLDDVRMFKALAGVMLDEFNAIRTLGGWPLRTKAQLRAALRDKIDQV